MWGIKLVIVGSTIRLGESHAPVPQFLEVDLGEHGQRHEVQSSHEVGGWGYQIDQHQKHNETQ